jgi:Domain of unknown function (DUF4260)
VRVGTLLRAEGLAVAAASVVLFVELGESWWLFAALVLAPDLAFVGYLAGPRFGAHAYNAAHNLVLPVVLGAGGVVADSDLAMAVALTWLTHIGVDRLLGYGLKYPSAFKDTHLQRV